MSRPLLPLALAAALLLAALACWVPDLPWLDGKACDDVHLCVRGVCLAGQCVLSPPGKDASTPVLVTRSALHALEDGTVVPVQEIPANLDMLVETTGGAFVTLQPTVADGGLMIFWDAPPGQAYVLRLGNRHFVSDAGRVDLSERVLGRPGLTAPSPGTALRTQLNCLSTWDPLDEMQLTAAGAGLGGLDLSTLPGWTPPLPANPNQLNTSESWTTAATPGLIRTTQGDHPVYVQLEHNTFNQLLPDGGQVAVDRWQGKHSWSNYTIDMQDGAETAIPFACSSKDLSLRGVGQLFLRGAAFGAHVPELGGGATLTAITASIHQAVWPAGPGPDVYRNALSTPDDLTVNMQVSSALVFPATWENEAVVVTSGIVPVPLQLDGGGTTAFEPVRLVSRRALPADGSEMAPALSPPQLVLVNGEDASAGATGTGVQPEVTWTAPALGAPAAYEVAVWREQDPSRLKAPRLEGTIWTDVPRVRIPPGLMTPRATYVLHVRAVAAPMDPLRAPLLSGLPYDEAETVTGLIEP